MPHPDSPDPVDTTGWQPSPDTTEVPAELADHPRYRLLGVLGEGGMGTVYKAEHRLMKRPVALKVVRDSLLEKPAIRERFLREVRTSAALAHPNIAVAHDSENAGSLCFLVMEYVEGESLGQLVRRRGPLPAAEACDYVRQAALGLQHAFERGLVHRDIKPGNLMLTPQGLVKLLDFGLARFTLEEAAEQTVPGVVLGTPAFMAPEQMRNAREADIRADIYSLGCTLVALLAGRTTPVALSTLQPSLPARLTSVLRRLLAEDPNRRYSTPAEVAAALAPFTADSRPVPARSGRRWRRGLAVAGALLGGCVLVGVCLAPYLAKPAENGEPDVGQLPPPDAKQEMKARPAPAAKEGKRTTISLTAGANPIVWGQSVRLTATVAPTPPFTGVPMGPVTFRANGQVLGTAPLVGQQATFTTTLGMKGTVLVTASYSGDPQYEGATSPPVSISVLVPQKLLVTVGGATGQFTLTFNGQTTRPLSVGATANEARDALNALSSIGGVGGFVTVAKSENVYTVTLGGILAESAQPLMTYRAAGGATVEVSLAREKP